MPTGIQLSSGVVVGQPIPLDAKFGPYNSTTDALNDISVGLRYRGLTVGILESGVLKEYWFKDGTANGDFVAKSSDVTWDSLQNKPSTFTPAAHQHAIGDVTNLQTELDAKLQAAYDSEQYIVAAGLVGITGPEQLPARRNTMWNVSFIVSGMTRTIKLPTGTSVRNGDRLILSGTAPINTTVVLIKPNPTAAGDETIATIAGGQAFYYVAEVVGISNGVPNWTETSTLQGCAPSVHTHPISDVTNLQTHLNNKVFLLGSSTTAADFYNSPDNSLWMADGSLQEYPVLTQGQPLVGLRRIVGCNVGSFGIRIQAPGSPSRSSAPIPSGAIAYVTYDGGNVITATVERRVDAKELQFTGSYGDLPNATSTERGLMSASALVKLQGIASGAEVNVNADWNATSGDAQILNKPDVYPSHIRIQVGTTSYLLYYAGLLSGKPQYMRRQNAGTVLASLSWSSAVSIWDFVVDGLTVARSASTAVNPIDISPSSWTDPTTSQPVVVFIEPYFQSPQGVNSSLVCLSNDGTWTTLGNAALRNVGTTAGTVAAGDDTRLSDSRTPSSHASTHHTGGTDAIAPNNIGAGWALVTSNQVITGNTLLSAGRNRRITLSVVATANVDLPYENNVNGDVLTLVQGATGGYTAEIRRVGAILQAAPIAYSTLARLTSVGQSLTFVSDGTATGWSLRAVDTHTHAASDISDSTTAGRALLTAASVQDQRDALNVFVGVTNFAALPTPGVTVSAGGSVYVTNDNGKVYVWNGTAYTEISPNVQADWNATSGDAQILNKPSTFPPSTHTHPYDLVVACSDEVTALTAGEKVRFLSPRSFTFTRVGASVTTAPQGASLLVDIRVNGSSIFESSAAVLAIPSGQTSFFTTAQELGGMNIEQANQNDVISIHIIQTGVAEKGRGLKAYLTGQ